MQAPRLLFSVLLLGIAAPAAAADPPSRSGELVDPWGNTWSATKGHAAPSPRELAQEKAGQALDLYDKGSWQEAHERFVEAEQLVHAPTLLLYMARCKDKLGKLLEARALYARVIAEPLPKNAPEAFVRGHREAEAELAALRARIPSLAVTVVGPAAGAATVSIDGIVTDGPRELDPGAHRLEVTATGTVSVTRNVALSPGRAVELAIPLEPAPRPVESSQRPVESSPPWWPAGLAYGLGGAGLGVFAVTGALALAKANAIKSHCQGDLCLASDQGNANTAGDLGTASTVGLVAGVAGVVAGTVLVVVRPGGGDRAAASGAVWSVRAGLGRLEIGREL